MKYLMEPEGFKIHKVADTTEWPGFEEVTVGPTKSKAYDLLKAVVARIQAGEMQFSFAEIEAVKDKQISMFLDGNLKLKLVDWPSEDSIKEAALNGE